MSRRGGRTSRLFLGLVAIVAMLSAVSSPAAQAAGESALDLVEARRWVEAEQVLRDMEEAGRAGPSVEFLLGYVLVQQVRFSEALAHLEKAVEGRPDRPRWLHLQAVCLLELGRCGESIEVLDRVLALQNLPGHHFDKALCALNIGDLALAEEELQTVLSVAPEHYGARLELGELLADRGEDQQAEMHFLRALDLQPGQVEARFRLAMVQLRAGRTGEAVAGFRRVLAEVPGHLSATYNLGRALMALGEKEEGREVLVRFRELSRHEETIENHLQYLQLEPTAVDVRIELARLLLEAGRTSEAVIQLETARRSGGPPGETNRLLAVAYGRLGRAKEAARWTQEQGPQ